MGSPARPIPSLRRATRPRRTRRHVYPEKFINRRQETLMALLFGILGLAVMAIVLGNADAILCAISATSADCEPASSAAED